MGNIISDVILLNNFEPVSTKCTRMSIRSIFIFCVLSSLFVNRSDAQVEDVDITSVRQVIHTMFEGMRLGDSAMVSQVFYPKAQFFSAFMTPQGESKLNQGSVQDWLNAIGTPHEQVWNEEWWDPSIKVDGNFAHAWTPYAFYVDDTFSHCGVDSFHFVKDDQGSWKVFHATDTHRKANCDTFIPDYIKAKHASKN